MASTDSSPRSLLVTAALIYANGPVHLGHLVEYIQADVWVRFQQLRGHSCLYICGNDAHGTPIMLSAQKRGITPEVLIAEMHEAHLKDFNDFLIHFDSFYTTHSEENRKLTELVYERLKQQGDISQKTISQAFDPINHVFLPDRFIRGECPRCHAKDQYGDNCEACGATYTPMELINPKSVISGATPIAKETLHFFFNLDRHQDHLKNWISAGHCQAQISNKLKEWFDVGLKPWDITRDAPYFGFEIPGSANKFFYVWVDAPIGYMSSLQHYCQNNPEINFDNFWGPQAKTELYHFIGKDIVYFHALFWPAMLHSAEFRLPTQIFAHGYLTINGEKMSKSRGTFITARDYLNELNPEYLRYYYCAKLSAQIEDIDLNWTDFIARVNADLVGKYVNLASRCAGFIKKYFANQLADQLPNPDLFAAFIEAGESIAQHFESLNYNKAVREIMALADRANQYIDQEKPWIMAKMSDSLENVQKICTQGLNLFYILTIYLKPILPKTADAVERFLNTSLQWSRINNPLLNHRINDFIPLMQRVPEATLFTQEYSVATPSREE